MSAQVPGIYNWYAVPDVLFSKLEENKISSHLVHDKVIALLRKAGSVYAFAATCPHAGAPFCEGWTDAKGQVVCPLHKYRFDPANGRNTSGEGYKLKTYPAELRNDQIFVGLLP